MSKWLWSVVVVTGLSVSSTQAQVYLPIGPGGVQPYPYAGGYGYGGYGGYGFGGYSGIFGPALRSGVFGGGTISTPVVPSLVNQQSPLSTGALIDETSDNITGHPTRFNSYGRYFFNQGGTNATSTTTLSTPVGVQAGSELLRTQVGTAPPRGRANTTRP